MNDIYLKVIKRIILSNCGENIGIFIDLDNIYHNLQDFGLRMTEDDYNIFTVLWSIYDWDKVRNIKAFADYDQIKLKLRDLQKQRIQIRQVYGNGFGDESRKNASDIELSLDALESLYKNENIDTYVFVTADSDMIPIMSRMIFKGKKVHLFYFSTHLSQVQNVTQYSHVSIDLVKLFKIDIRRKTPEFWKDDVINVIKAWHNKPSNSNKALGLQFVKSELNDKLNLSYGLTNETLIYLEKHRYIQKRIKVLSSKSIEEYYA